MVAVRFRTLFTGVAEPIGMENVMLRRAIALVALVVLATGCGLTESGSEALSNEWLDFDPCQLGDTATVAALLGDKKLTTEIIETYSLLGDSDEVTGRNCKFEAANRRSMTVWFGQGSSPLDRGGRLVELSGVGDKAGMTVADGTYDPDQEGEILGIVVNVSGMSIIVSTSSRHFPREGTAEADQLVDIARIAADRMRAAVGTA